MKKWPVYFYDKLIIGDPKNNVGVVSLWTPVEKIAENLDKKTFSVAGQLYSKEGINFVIRNILANPRITKLVICGEDRIGSGLALMNFLEKGINDQNMVPDTDFCQIHTEIGKDAIKSFRDNITFENQIGEFDAKKIQNIINQFSKTGKNWRVPELFPEKKIEFDGVMPTDQSVFKIRKKYIGEAWVEILKKILKFGTIRESFHGNNCKELFNVATVITDEDPENIKLFPYFQITKEDINNYIPKFMTGDRGTADYTYGERLWNYPDISGGDYKLNQVDDIIVDFLTRYPTDRAAVAAMMDPRDHTAKSEPCMTFVQATNVDDKLDLTAYFRSHDIFGGWLLNAFGLRHLQGYVADKLKWPIGNLTIYSNCAHIYDNNWELAQKIVRDYGRKLDCTSDPRGYLMISLEKNEIVAKHISPNGKPIQEFRQDGFADKATMKMYNKLVLEDIVSLIPHAFDVGAELQKAEIAVKQGLKYTQDRPLVF